MRELKRQSRTFVEDIPDKKSVSNSINRTEPFKNVEITQRKRSEEHGENVEMSLGDPTLLVGSQRIVFKTLFELSQKYASLDTPPLTLGSLANLSQLKTAA